MKIALTIARVIVGLLFIFSGLVKANDPLGLSYKMQEFFAVWGMSSLNDYTLFFSLVMNSFEIIAGVAVLLGWRMRFFSWLLLLLIIFFTFLTAYALFSGKIKACGCFGDCIPLTPLHSFIKDIILLVLIGFIFRYRHRIQPFFSSGTNGGIILMTTLLCIVMQWWVLKHLPFVDCLPYKVGNDLSEKMKVPEGAVPDSFSIVFKYKKEGKIVEFDMNNFPEDYNDSTYEYVDRVQKLVRAGTGKAAITDFILIGMSGADTTEAILSRDHPYVMMFLKDLESSKKRWEETMPAVVNAARHKKVPFYVVSSVADLVQAHVKTIAGVDTGYVRFLKCDATVIKTAARENPTYILMQRAKVMAKYAAADAKQMEKKLNGLD